MSDRQVDWRSFLMFGGLFIIILITSGKSVFPHRITTDKIYLFI